MDVWRETYNAKGDGGILALPGVGPQWYWGGTHDCAMDLSIILTLEEEVGICQPELK